MNYSLALKKLQKNIAHFAMLMAFPVLIIGGINASMILFLLIVSSVSDKKQIFKVSNFPSTLAVLIALGSIISVLHNDIGQEGFKLGFQVLPNYIYWCILIIVLTNITYQINTQKISKFVFIGLVLTTVYFFIKDVLLVIPIFNMLALNQFAFLCIAFTGIAVTYLKRRFNIFIALLFLMVIVVILVDAGRRSGTFLTLFTGLASLLLPRLRLINGIMVAFVGIFMVLLLGTSSVEQQISDANPRIHEIIYETDEVKTSDRSYLTRLLMIEKAMIIFSEHPFTGIGLNGFKQVEVDFKGDFEGAEFVEGKDGNNQLSAHNSYINIIAEGGLFLIVPFLALLLYNAFYFVIDHNKRNPYENAVYWCFLGVCTHLYFIAAIVNVHAWFIIGLTSAISVKYRNPLYAIKQA